MTVTCWFVNTSLKPMDSAQRIVNTKTTQQLPFYGHFMGQPALVDTSSYELEDYVGAKFYCPHVLAESKQCIQIKEKTLKFSSTV